MLSGKCSTTKKCMCPKMFYKNPKTLILTKCCHFWNKIPLNSISGTSQHPLYDFNMRKKKPWVKTEVSLAFPHIIPLYIPQL